MLGLVRQTAEGLAELVGKHVALARLELAADLGKIASRARLVAVLSALIAIGYALAMAGLAVSIGGDRAVGVPLLIVGAGHLGAGLAALRLAKPALGRKAP